MYFRILYGLHKIESRTNYTNYFFKLFFSKLRSLLFSKRKALRQNAFNVHQSPAQRQTCASQSIIISFSLPRAIRQGWKKCKATVDKTNGTSRRLSIVSCGDPLGSPPGALRESKQNGRHSETRLYKSVHNEPLRVEIEMNVNQLWDLLTCVRRHSVPIGHEMEDRLSWEPDNLAHRTWLSSAWGLRASSAYR